MMRPTAQQIIDHFDMKRLPVEGGIFRQMYRSPLTLPQSALPDVYKHDKPAGTAILFLYTNEPDVFSALHSLPTDEIYHFYLGDPVELTLLYPDGRGEIITMGTDILNGQHVQFVIPGGTIQGARLHQGGAYALLGMTMAPGFTNSDYTGYDRDDLITRYPNFAAQIHALTRPDTPHTMPDGY